MNIADLLIVVVLLIGFFSGLVRGFVRGLLGLVGLFLGIMLAAGQHARLAGYLSFIPGDRAPEIVSFIAIFLVVIILIAVIARIVAKALKLATLGWLDRLLGGVLGAGIASVVVGVLILLAVMAGLQESKMLVESRMAPRVLRVTDLIVNVLPQDARTVVEEHYGKLRAEWEKSRERIDNLVEIPIEESVNRDRVV